MEKKIKIAILTQPLHDNYGGLLQAYALSKKLDELGHEPIIINRRFGSSNFFRKLISDFKRKIFGSKRYVPTSSERAVISKHTLEFRDKYFPNLTEGIFKNQKMLKLNKNGYGAYIVGSDQCWRPRYSPNINNYFLDFAKGQTNLKRIAYAASFGTSEWEFSPEQTEVCKELVQKFDAISVREDSAIDLCARHFSQKAIHVLDPTMLWERRFYDEMVDSEKVEDNQGNLKAYILDKDEEKTKIIKYLEERLNLKAFEVMPSKRLGKIKPEKLIDYQYPSPLKWLKGYQNAKFVIADSFHGIVFSILYNVPFIAIGNKNRGMARFTSLLKMFNLENRLITDLSQSNNINNILVTEIDWDIVNSILEDRRKESINFLKQNLL